VRALLISTYDLGRQPFGLASPAAWLRREGIEVDCVDTSRDELADGRIQAADFVAVYLPMHTATRLAGPVLDRVRAVNPRARVAAYGLYAPLNAAWLRARGVAHVIGPEAEHELVALATTAQVPNPEDQTAGPDRQVPGETQLLDQSDAGRSRIARLAFIPPDRAGLPPLSQYARLHLPDGSRRIVGSTDATRGCKHLCRHCPIVPVYRGAFRAVPLDVVIADVRAQVDAGAEHISFGDPDFFNGPTHARRLVERLRAEFPGLTFDVTIKIEHLLAHADLLPLLRDSGCVLITSAVESVDDEVLGKLRKGHTRADFERAVASCRDAGVTLTPTFVPFTPWTTLGGYVDLIATLERLDLVDAVAPIQLAIRLLVTAQSALFELPEIGRLVGPFDADSLTWPWPHPDPRVDRLQQDVMGVVSAAAGRSRGELFAAIAALARERAAVPAPPIAPRASRPVPFMSEPWYCCAEPSTTLDI
jgi:radical SAM superfamily enzyme YgiQ (UPF0313 family)